VYFFTAALGYAGCFLGMTHSHPGYKNLTHHHRFQKNMALSVELACLLRKDCDLSLASVLPSAFSAGLTRSRCFSWAHGKQNIRTEAHVRALEWS